MVEWSDVCEGSVIGEDIGLGGAVGVDRESET